jgi:hypothetical protein
MLFYQHQGMDGVGLYASMAQGDCILSTSKNVFNGDS